jgi:hypothetical protein
MMKMISIILGICCMTSCLVLNPPTNSLESERDLSFRETISSIDLFIDVGNVKYDILSKQEVTLSEYLSVMLKTKFEDMGIKTRVERVKGLDLNENYLSQAVGTSTASGIMVVSLEEGVLNQYKLLINAVFDISIHSVPSGKRIWRGKLIADGGGDTNPIRDRQYESIVQELLAKLRTDGLIK